MDETIYQMSLTENLLVIFVIFLWLIAVIHLARKLERICNPPSIRPNYSPHQSAVHSNPSIQAEHSSMSSWTRAQTLIRCTSEPVIDPEHRSTVQLVRFPSETCLPVRTSIGEQNSSLTVIDQIPSSSPMTLFQSKPFIYPKRLPSIVRRSLLDLHRRALSQTSNPRSLARIDDDGEETTMVISSTRNPFLRKTYQRSNAIDQEVCDDFEQVE